MSKRFAILCVDGDASSLSQIQEILSPEFDVSSAATAELALQMVEGASFDVICCDAKLPGTTGLDLLRRVAKKDARAELVFFTSTKSLFLDRANVPSESICYVFKPYRPDRLLQTVRSLAATAASKPPRA